MDLLLRGLTPVTSPPRPRNTGSFRLRTVVGGGVELEDRSLSSRPSSIKRVRVVRCCAAKVFAFTSRESLMLSVVFIKIRIEISVQRRNCADSRGEVFIDGNVLFYRSRNKSDGLFFSDPVKNGVSRFDRGDS